MFKYFWKGNVLGLTALLAIIVVSWGMLVYIPFALGSLINTFIEGHDISLAATILPFVFVVLFTSFLLLCLGIAEYRFRTRLIKTIQTDMAKKMITTVTETSSVTNIFNLEIEQLVGRYFFVAIGIVKIAVSTVFAIALGVSIAWQIILFVLAISVVSFLINGRFSGKLAALQNDVQSANTGINKMLLGLFASIRTVNIFLATPLALLKLDNVFERKRISEIAEDRFNVWLRQLNNIIGYLTQYGLIIGAFVFVYQGRLNIGEALTLQYLMQYLTSPLFNVMNSKNSIASTKGLRAKFEQILSKPDALAAGLLPVGNITLNNVSFSYTEDKFMDGITLELIAGKRYLIVGESGSGKSTLLKLLLKENAPTAGTIMYSEYNMSEISEPTWYRSIAYAGQNVEIVPGSLRENIVLGAEYEEDRFNRAVAILNLGHLRDKFDIELEEDLSNFSGGELQRIAIARMLYKDSSIFIFDEFSSALDNMNALHVEKELLNIEGKLLISVTHRIQPSLLSEYDQIIIMENGNIKHIGNSKTLELELQQYIAGYESL